MKQLFLTLAAMLLLAACSTKPAATTTDDATTTDSIAVAPADTIDDTIIVGFDTPPDFFTDDNDGDLEEAPDE